jgi:hypothetical protein
MAPLQARVEPVLRRVAEEIALQWKEGLGIDTAFEFTYDIGHRLHMFGLGSACTCPDPADFQQSTPNCGIPVGMMRAMILGIMQNVL